MMRKVKVKLHIFCCYISQSILCIIFCHIWCYHNHHSELENHKNGHDLVVLLQDYSFGYLAVSIEVSVSSIFANEVTSVFPMSMLAVSG